VVKKGDIVGIYGKNGSGKTTLVELLLGFLKPKNGEILVNNVDLYALKEAYWRTKISLMPQKPYFFEDSLRNNLTLFNADIEDDDLQEFVRLVGAEHIIENLPDDLSTILANHRIGLSGGELQKLSLIRVLLMNPDIIILDEPFNHLDIQSCENLKEVILKIAKNKMIFIIEHHHEIMAEIANKTIFLGASKAP
jgi:ABC-type multidrug transport system fused ATPase/permease subunit